MLNWMDRKIIIASMKIKQFLEDERGGPTFLDIIILLGITVILVGVFIGLKDQILSKVVPFIESFEIH